MEGLLAISPFTLPPPPFRIEPEADVAQLVEQPIRNRQVTSSTLVVGSSLSNDLLLLLTAPSIHCDVDCDVDCADRWPRESIRARDADTASRYAHPCGP